MDINLLDERIILQRRTRALDGCRRHIYPQPTAAWIQGWQAAIKFAKQVAESEDVCGHCGKLIGLEEWNCDGEIILCNKCYDKLYKPKSKI